MPVRGELKAGRKKCRRGVARFRPTGRARIQRRYPCRPRSDRRAVNRWGLPSRRKPQLPGLPKPRRRRGTAIRFTGWEFNPRFGRPTSTKVFPPSALVAVNHHPVGIGARRGSRGLNHRFKDMRPNDVPIRTAGGERPGTARKNMAQAVPIQYLRTRIRAEESVAAHRQESAKKEMAPGYRRGGGEKATAFKAIRAAGDAAANWPDFPIAGFKSRQAAVHTAQQDGKYCNAPQPVVKGEHIAGAPCNPLAGGTKIKSRQSTGGAPAGIFSIDPYLFSFFFSLPGRLKGRRAPCLLVGEMAAGFPPRKDSVAAKAMQVLFAPS